MCSVTTWWNKKLPNVSDIDQKVAKSFLHESYIIKNSPKRYQNSYGYFVRKFVTKKFKNRPIWSHWSRPLNLFLPVVKASFSSFATSSFNAVNKHPKQLCGPFCFCWLITNFSLKSVSRDALTKSKKNFFDFFRFVTFTHRISDMLLRLLTTQ